MTDTKEALAEGRRAMLIHYIKRSGLSVGDFARKYLARDESTVYRWLKGSYNVPNAVGNWMIEHAPDVVRR